MPRTCALWTVLLSLTALSSCRCSVPPQPTQVRIGGHTWQVELAADDQSRQRGLGGRYEVPEGTGMLFVFPDKKVLTFHMLDCRAALDVAFISEAGRIIRIHTMPVEQDPQNPAYHYSSVQPARFALEVAAGSFQRAGVKVGDKVELPAGVQ